MPISITPEHIQRAYEVGKAVHGGHMRRGDAVADLASHGMGRGSAGDYVQVIRCLLDGQRYTRAISTTATETYLKSIRSEFGAAGLERALAAVFAHVDYCDALGYGRLRQTRQIAERYARHI